MSQTCVKVAKVTTIFYSDLSTFFYFKKTMATNTKGKYGVKKI
jgi:hypothetical protein